MGLLYSTTIKMMSLHYFWCKYESFYFWIDLFFNCYFDTFLHFWLCYWKAFLRKASLHCSSNHIFLFFELLYHNCFDPFYRYSFNIHFEYYFNFTNFQSYFKKDYSCCDFATKLFEDYSKHYFILFLLDHLYFAHFVSSLWCSLVWNCQVFVKSFVWNLSLNLDGDCFIVRFDLIMEGCLWQLKYSLW